MRKSFKVVLLIESSRGSGRHMLQGIARYAHYYGPWSFYWEPGGLEKAWPTLKQLKADGIILRDVDKLDEVLNLGIPAVVVGHGHKEVPGLINVVTDSTSVGRMAAEHLINCGFKHFAFCGCANSHLEHTPWSGQRQQAFSKSIVDAGFARPKDYLLSLARPNWLRERQRLARWLASLPRPVGIMAANDDCGAQVMEACKLGGLEVPDQVGIVGVDNDEVVCGLSDPPMTSVAVNFERAGYDAARALEKAMRQGRANTAKISVPATHVVTRRSTDVVSVDDKYVAKAMNFIRYNAKSPITVNDVVKDVGVSRRSLERRFQREMGVSILSEIRRARTDQIAKLLLESELPVWQIAASLGFEDAQHFARYFRSIKKISPLAFRKSRGNWPAAKPT